MPDPDGRAIDKMKARMNRDAQLGALSASRNADAARKSREAQTVNAQKTLSYGGARVGNLPVETQERLVHRASGMTKKTNLTDAPRLGMVPHGGYGSESYENLMRSNGLDPSPAPAPAPAPAPSPAKPFNPADHSELLQRKAPEGRMMTMEHNHAMPDTPMGRDIDKFLGERHIPDYQRRDMVNYAPQPTNPAAKAVFDAMNIPTPPVNQVELHNLSAGAQGEIGHAGVAGPAGGSAPTREGETTVNPANIYPNGANYPARPVVQTEAGQRAADVMHATGALRPGALPNANAVAQQTIQGIQQDAIRQADLRDRLNAESAARQAGANAVHERAMADHRNRMDTIGTVEQTGQSLQSVLSQQAVANAGVAGVNNAAFRQPLGLGSGNATSVSAPAAVGSVGPGMDPAQAQALLAQHEALPVGSMAASQQRGFDRVQAARPGSGMGAGLERAAANVVSTAGGASISQKDVMDFARSSGQSFVDAKRQLEGEARDRFNQTQAADRAHELAGREFDTREFEAKQRTKGQIRAGESAAKIRGASEDKRTESQERQHAAGLASAEKRFGQELESRGLDRAQAKELAEKEMELRKHLGELGAESQRELQDALIKSQGDPRAKMMLDYAASQTDPGARELAFLNALKYMRGQDSRTEDFSPVAPPPVDQGSVAERFGAEFRETIPGVHLWRFGKGLFNGQ